VVGIGARRLPAGARDGIQQIAEALVTDGVDSETTPLGSRATCKVPASLEAARRGPGANR